MIGLTVGARSNLRFWVLAFGVIAITGYGCATGKAMTDAEMSEFEQLGTKISEKQSVVNAKNRKLKTAFDRSSIGSSSKKVQLCGVKHSEYKTGKVPLVYGAKKRVIFSMSTGETTCRNARVEVKK